jgi:hypothetical protein
MLSLALWPILAVWAGLAFVVLAVVVSVLGYATLHMLRDRRGLRGAVWCPVSKTTFRVVGLPAAFTLTDLPTTFTDLRRCERWGKGAVECGKWCVKAGALAKAAATN